MVKHSYIGKTFEETKNKAVLDLQETEENLIITMKEEIKSLFSKKVEIEVIEKREVKDYIKSLLKQLLYDMGFQAEIEVQMTHDIPTYRIYSNHDALLIGKNGKNLNALTFLIKQILQKEIHYNYRFFLDVSDYKEKNDKHLEMLARKIAKEVKETKIEVKLDSMNSYERRIVHNALSNNKYVYTESVGEEPNRAVVIKPKED
ncbi:MAG TPA: hypothetical protein IAC24_04460 [Candidatus Onthousia faecigallinarum]|nr:hypothetical protein [Candidatus Onthousia faecigallinarum]